LGSEKRKYVAEALEDLSDRDRGAQPVLERTRLTSSTTSANGKHSSSLDHTEPQHPSAYEFSSLLDADRCLVDEQIQFLGRLLEVPEAEILNMTKLPMTKKHTMRFIVDDDELLHRKERRPTQWLKANRG
jgi:hypothetical protein